MRKLIFSLLTALLLVAAAVVLHKTNIGNQELFQANVEALTQIETNRYDCYAIHQDADDDELAVWMFICNGCDYRWVTYASLMGFCVK